MADSKDDYTEHYNTPLSEPEQQSYDGWEKAQSDKLGRDVHQELKDYDMQGYWRANVGDTDEGPQLGQGHLTDTFKKPNHPTFSDESIYHGVAGNKGGHWEELPGGETGVSAWSFKPGATNLEHHEPAELRGYFDRVEPGNAVDLPTPQAPGGVAGLSNRFIAGIKQSEGFEPVARWDYKQYSSGYGTRANYPGEVIDRATADERFGTEITKAAQFVDNVNPKLDAGSRAALTSLTYNAGGGWASGVLGERVRAGDINGAREMFLNYNRAGGAVNPGLVSRRAREAAWFGQNEPGDVSEAGTVYEAASAAAARMRRAVRPEGGRREGAATDVATHIIPTMARGAVSSALAGPRAMEEVFAGELDPTSPEGIAAARNIALGTVGRPAMKPSLGSGVALPGAKEVATEAAKQPIRQPERRSRDEPRAAPPDRLPDVSEIKALPKSRKRTRAADRA
jgi:lysozyme